MKATQMPHDPEQSIWFDNITRELLTTGILHDIDELSVTGLISNPTIFDHAIKNSTDYDAAIRQKLRDTRSGEELFVALALEDITRAADLFASDLREDSRCRRPGIPGGLGTPGARCRQHFG